MNWNSIFEYNPAGFLVNKRTKKKAGTTRKDGYCVTRVMGKFYLIHRIIWEMINKPLLDGEQIDHINHNRSDNKINNLRVVTNKVNTRNQSKSLANKSGVTGVFWASNRNKWCATIMVDARNKHLGYFNEMSDAIKARRASEAVYGFHPNHGK